MSEHLRSLVRDVPDFPSPGILFRDISPLLQDPAGLRETMAALIKPWKSTKASYVAGMEARGFILGPSVAVGLDAGFLPLRKPGKLPCAVVRQEYELEYGTAALELHRDALSAGDRVVIVDDVLATGGTARAAIRLVESLQATVVGLAFLIELTALNGRDGLENYRMESVITY